jgi:hypothetical protein
MRWGLAAWTNRAVRSLLEILAGLLLVEENSYYCQDIGASCD